MSKILILEADDEARKLFDTAIKFQGIDTIPVASVQDALDKIDETLDVILIDVTTPKLPKVNLIKEIEKRVKGKVPLIIIADMREKEELVEYSIYGACQYLAKSNLKVGEIIRQVRRAIDEKQKKK